MYKFYPPVSFFGKGKQSRRSTRFKAGWEQRSWLHIFESFQVKKNCMLLPHRSPVPMPLLLDRRKQENEMGDSGFSVEVLLVLAVIYDAPNTGWMPL